jgi:hypothetical protein
MDASESTTPAPSPAQPQQVNLTDVNVTDENVALNVLIGFLTVCQKRGAFSIDESAKVWECIKFFMKSNDPPSEETVEVD